MWFAALIVGFLLARWGWANVPKTWSAVEAQWGMDPDHPENISEGFNRGVSAPGVAGVAMSVGVFAVVSGLVLLVAS